MTKEEKRAYFIKAMEIGRLKGLAEALEFMEHCHDSNFKILKQLDKENADKGLTKMIMAKAFQVDHMRVKATKDFLSQMDKFEKEYGFRPTKVKDEPVTEDNLVKFSDGKFVIANRVEIVRKIMEGEKNKMGG